MFQLTRHSATFHLSPERSRRRDPSETRHEAFVEVSNFGETASRGGARPGAPLRVRAFRLRLGRARPERRVAAQERQILIDSLAIMLAIVIPTIIAIAGFRLVVPRRQPARALSARFRIFRPGRTGRLVDPDADRAAARRRHLDRLAPARSAPPLDGKGKPIDIQVVSLDWKWLFIYPDAEDRQRQRARRAGRRAAAASADLGQRDDGVLRAATGQHDLHDERHDVAAQPARRPGRRLSAASPRISAATAFPTCSFDARAVSPEDFAPGRRAPSGPPAFDARRLSASSQAGHGRRPSCIRSPTPSLFDDIVSQKLPPGPGPTPATAPTTVGGLTCSAS